MINLLPNDYKNAVLYARRNTSLLRLCGGLIIVALGAALIVGAGQLYLTTTTKRYEKSIASAKASLQEQKIDETKRQVQELSGSVNLVLKVLSKEILFSKLFERAGVVMPKGSSLSTFEISGTEGGIDIEAGVLNYQAGTQVQINLQDPNNKIFEKVDLVGVVCENKDPDALYPCKASLRALFGDSSPYYFINQNQRTNQ